MGRPHASRRALRSAPQHEAERDARVKRAFNSPSRGLCDPHCAGTGRMLPFARAARRLSVPGGAHERSDTRGTQYRGPASYGAATPDEGAVRVLRPRQRGRDRDARQPRRTGPHKTVAACAQRRLRPRPEHDPVRQKARAAVADRPDRNCRLGLVPRRDRVGAGRGKRRHPIYPGEHVEHRDGESPGRGRRHPVVPALCLARRRGRAGDRRAGPRCRLRGPGAHGQLADLQQPRVRYP